MVTGPHAPPTRATVALSLDCEIFIAPALLRFHEPTGIALVLGVEGMGAFYDGAKGTAAAPP